MEQNDETGARICNENTTTTISEDVIENFVDKHDEIIPIAMLTPPPTSEPVITNGSPCNSTNATDLQQLSGKDSVEASVSLFDDVDNDGNTSNHSTNSDSNESNALVINEMNDGSIDSNLSNTDSSKHQQLAIHHKQRQASQAATALENLSPSSLSPQQQDAPVPNECDAFTAVTTNQVIDDDDIQDVTSTVAEPLSQINDSHVMDSSIFDDSNKFDGVRPTRPIDETVPCEHTINGVVDDDVGVISTADQRNNHRMGKRKRSNTSDSDEIQHKHIKIDNQMQLDVSDSEIELSEEKQNSRPDEIENHNTTDVVYSDDSNIADGGCRNEQSDRSTIEPCTDPQQHWPETDGSVASVESIGSDKMLGTKDSEIETHRYMNGHLSTDLADVEQLNIDENLPAAINVNDLAVTEGNDDDTELSQASEQMPSNDDVLASDVEQAVASDVEVSDSSTRLPQLNEGFLPANEKSQYHGDTQSSDKLIQPTANLSQPAEEPLQSYEETQQPCQDTLKQNDQYQQPIEKIPQLCNEMASFISNEFEAIINSLPDTNQFTDDTATTEHQQNNDRVQCNIIDTMPQIDLTDPNVSDDEHSVMDSSVQMGSSCMSMINTTGKLKKYFDDDKVILSAPNFANTQYDCNAIRSNEFISTSSINSQKKLNTTEYDSFSKNNALAEMTSPNVIMNTATRRLPTTTVVDNTAIDLATLSNQLSVHRPNGGTRQRRQVFFCSACGTYYEKWNLFYHIREIHNKFICLFCLGIFPTAERLVNHLESKHVAKPSIYEHTDDLMRMYRDQCYLMCCVCEHIFTESDDIIGHSCEQFMKPCTLCGLQFIHKNDCTALHASKVSQRKQRKARSQVQVVTASALPPSIASISQQTQWIPPNATIPPNQLATDVTDHALLRNALLGQEQRHPQYDNRLAGDLHQMHPAVQQFDNSNQQLSTIQVTPTEAPKYVANEHIPNWSMAANQMSQANDAYRVNSSMQYANGQYNVDISRTDAVPQQQHQQAASNTESSSDSDDSNSDSSSNDSDADTDEMENNSNVERVVPALRLNLSEKAGNMSRSYVARAPVNPGKNINNMLENQSVDIGDESGNEDDHNNSGFMNGNSYQSKLSDINSIQMQLNDIQNQVNAIQHKTSDGDIEQHPQQHPPLVPKLKLKLSQPLQSIESEQSSTESDDDGDNSSSDNNGDDDADEQEHSTNTENISMAQGVFGPMPNEYPCDPNTLHIQHQHEAQIDDQFDSNNSNSFCNEASQQHEQQPLELSHLPNEQSLHDTTSVDAAQISPQDRSFSSDLLPSGDFTGDFDERLTSTNTITQDTDVLNGGNIITPPNSIADSQPMEQDAETCLAASDPMLDIQSSQEQGQQAEISPIEAEQIEPEPDMRSITDFLIEQPLDKMPIKDLLRKCLESTYTICLYCNHARSIAVNGLSLAEHLIVEHRFNVTVDSITAEELMPETIEQKITGEMNDLAGIYFNLSTYDSSAEKTPDYQFAKHFECFQCRFASPIYKDLYLHNRKMHLRSALICLMCRSNFYSYSELVCHMCPGAQDKLIPFDLRFRCVLCNLDDIPSAFRLIVHIRKKHSACDVCLEECLDQSKLSCHVWKHKLHHLCYRCNITYRNKVDITRHLFWKHGTESVQCKRCMEKKWPHVYHFCVPPAAFTCEICSMSFAKALALKVHKRLHNPDFLQYACTMDDCEKTFISRKLQINHTSRHYMPELPPYELPPLVEGGTNGDSMADGIAGRDDIGEDLNVSVDALTTSPQHCSQQMMEPEGAPIDAVISAIEQEALMEKQDKQDKSIKSDVTTGSTLAAEHTPRKSKKSKRKDFSDLLDLPKLNLSESDSSSGSDDESILSDSAENSRHSMQSLFDKKAAATSVAGAAAVDEADGGKLGGSDSDIWASFKSFQAHQSLDIPDEEVDDETHMERLITKKLIILHVAQSDHDYAQMFKMPRKPKPCAQVPTSTPIIEETDKGEITVTFMEAEASEYDVLNSSQSPTPLPESTVTISADGNADDSKITKKVRRDSDSSSSSDSSGSDSSCSCGSNCSCSSSNSSDSSSSSDSDSDSSSPGSARKRLHSKSLKTSDRKSLERPSLDQRETAEANLLNVAPIETILEAGEKETEKPPSEIPIPAKSASPNAPAEEVAIIGEIKEEKVDKDESEHIDVGVESKMDIDLVDVETTDKKINKPDLDAIIVESDLETTDDETDDEDFYDEHPQKLAIQIFNEKRQPQFQPQLNPVNGMPFMNTTSRPATPSILPGEIEKQRGRTKRRRRNHKMRSPDKMARAMQSKLNTPFAKHRQSLNMTMQHSMSADQMTAASIDVNSVISHDTISAHAAKHPSMQSRIANDPHQIRLSTSSCSDADNPLKRSKRIRIPNKFYGYTSDEDSISAASALNSFQNPFKPTPPPNLTWSKEDLPKPSKNRGSALKTLMRLSAVGKVNKQRKAPLKGMKQSTIRKNRSSQLAKLKEKMKMATPTVPKIIIRGIPKANTQQSTNYTAPDFNNASRIPNAPVQRVSPPTFSHGSNYSTDDSDSDIDAGAQLNITQRESLHSHKLNKSYPHIDTAQSKPGMHTATTQQQPPMPFIRPDHTLLPPKRVSLTPSPPPQQRSAYTTAATVPNLLSSPIADGSRSKNDVYCYCQRPYDMVSEMIACDANDCRIEWFHFKCVGITVAPQDKWFCPDCRARVTQNHMNTTKSSFGLARFSGSHKTSSDFVSS